MKNKRGISPVVATVLLVVVVVILALLVFMWAKSMIKEACQKKIQEQMESIEQVCSEIELEASYNKGSGELQVINNGNIPIYSLEIRGSRGGEKTREECNEKLYAGGSISCTLSGDYEKVEIFPRVLAECGSQKKEYTCEKNPIIAEII